MRTPILMRERAVLRFLVLGLGGLLLLALVGWLVLDAGTALGTSRVVTRLEEKYGSLDPRSLVPHPPVPDPENRALLVQAAAGAVILIDSGAGPGDRWLLDRVSLLDDPAISDAQIDHLRAIVERNAETMELLGKAKVRPLSRWPIPYDQGFQADLPDLSAIVTLARLVAAAALVRIHDRQIAEAVDAIENGLAVAGSLVREPVLSLQMIRIAVDRMMLGALRVLLVREGVDAETAMRLDRAIGAAAPADAAERAYVGELKMFDHAFERIGSGEPVQLGDEPLPLLEMNADAALRWIARPVVRWDRQYFLEQMQRSIEYHRLPYHARRGSLVRAPRAEEIGWWHPFARSMFPDLEPAALRIDLDVARFVLARTALALRRYRLAHGAYPESLDAVVPEFLDEALHDPFTGRPPAYERHGPGFVLASRGAGPEEPGPSVGEPILVWSIPD